jgi:hypothetical protein
VIFWELFGEHVRNLGTLCFDTIAHSKKKSKRKSLNGKSTIQVESEPFLRTPYLFPYMVVKLS